MSPCVPRKAALLPILLALIVALAGCHGLMGSDEGSAQDDDSGRGGQPAANTGGGPPTPPAPPSPPAPPPSPPPAAPQNDDDDEEEEEEEDDGEEDEGPGSPPAPINATLRDVAVGANETLDVNLQVPDGYSSTTAAAKLANHGPENATGMLRLIGLDGEVLAEEAWTLPQNATLEVQVARTHPDGAPNGTYTARLTVETGAVWVETLRIEATAS